MKSVFAAIIFGLLASPAFAVQCQDLSGNYDVIDRQLKEVSISQDGCALTIVTSIDGAPSAPIYYPGDGQWITDKDSFFSRKTHTGFASKGSYVLEQKTHEKLTGKHSDRKDTIVKMLDGNLVLTSVYTQGNFSTAETHVLIRRAN